MGAYPPESEAYTTAREVGQLLAERGHTVVCGGRGGVMEAVCRGSTEQDGHSIAILPGTDTRQANDYPGFDGPEAVETPTKAVESVEQRV